jgi:nitrite reductase (NO-forming)
VKPCTHSELQLIAVILAVFIFLCTAIGIAPLAAQTAVRNKSDRRAVSGAADITRDPTDVPSPIGNRAPSVVHVTLVAREVLGQLDPAVGTTYRYWTFNGKVPGPMIRVKQGDTVEVTLQNDAHSTMVHSVDFHAALGPGGGAVFSQVLPGESKIFTFVATTPGLFVYHCGTPMVAQHISNGMYGLILVEPGGRPTPCGS